jgi:hypothetical protein
MALFLDFLLHLVLADDSPISSFFFRGKKNTQKYKNNKSLNKEIHEISSKKSKFSATEIYIPHIYVYVHEIFFRENKQSLSYERRTDMIQAIAKREMCEP